MENPFKSRIDTLNIISNWLQLKMNNQFQEEINLSDTYIIDVDGSGFVLPTDGESSLNDGQKSFLRTYCNMINNQEVTFEQLNEDLNN